MEGLSISRPNFPQRTMTATFGMTELCHSLSVGKEKSSHCSSTHLDFVAVSTFGQSRRQCEEESGSGELHGVYHSVSHFPVVERFVSNTTPATILP